MEQQAEIDVTRQLVRAARAIHFEDLPPDVVLLARQCLLDWTGVALAGAGEELARMLREHALFEGGNPQATLIGSGDRVSLPQAALVNGAASHALDFDDVQMDMSGHPSVPVLPALLALAEQRGASGRAFITAFVAGFEMECRIGSYVMPGHYDRGFHATGTLGTFGAAAACAHLLGLDEDQWLYAMGIAGAQAAGLKSMFGTMCKPLHAGKAAANGQLAALLAHRGFTSSTSVLETLQGFAATQTPASNPVRALAGLGEDFAIRRVLFKYHAACYGTHETIEGVLRLKERHGLAADDVESIHLEVPAGNLKMCNIQQPVTALEGKFSLRFTAALALSGGATTEEGFTDAAVSEPALVALRDRVSVEAAASGQRGTAVRVRTRDGRAFEDRVNLESPATDLDRQGQRLEAKFQSLALPVLGAIGANEVSAFIAELEHATDMALLMELCAAPAAVAV